MYQAHLLSVGGNVPPSEFEYFHNNKVNASCAFELSESGKNVFKISRSLGVSSMYADFFTESGEYIKSIECKWQAIEGALDVYSLTLPIKELGVGLYFYRPRIISFGEELFGKRSASTLEFSSTPELSGLFQLTVSSFAYLPPEEMYGGIIYHIFVDRFNRGTEVGVSDGAILVDGEWDRIPEYPAYPGAPLKNNTFYGGTLYGIIDKLDYIASLGTTAIYLSPIFKSVSNHKYDTADYMQVDEMFGGDRALQCLIRECNKRNIKIILDGVFNHTGADSVYFNRYAKYDSIGAYQSKESPYYSWFDFKEHPDKYTCWWDIEILPRINPDITECREYFVGDSGVVSKYSDMGVYGFRLDVADELSDDFISKIKARLSTTGSSVLYGEVWEDASCKIAYDKRKKYYLGTELDGVMNYPLRRGIIEYIRNKSIAPLEYALTEIINNAPSRIAHAQMNLLGTHDTERILTLLAGESAEGKSNEELSSLRMSKAERALALKRLRAAYTVLATLPGIPTIFYGDEAGLEGYSDPFNRMPYPWGKEDTELISHYKKIGNIRKLHDVYRLGEFKLYTLSEDVLVFSRVKGAVEYYTIFNNSDTELSAEFSAKSESLTEGEISYDHKILPMTAQIIKANRKSRLTIV